MNPARIDILGVPVDCVTMNGAVRTAATMLGGSRPHSILAVNPEKVMRARREPQLLGQLQRAGLLIPDGVGVVMAARLLKLGSLERVPGSELMPRLCALAAGTGHRVFLFGGSPEVNERAVTVLRQQYPGLTIVGSQHGYLTETEMPALIARINDLKTDLLFVALGSPKQELWIDRYLPRLRVKVCQGVGGTFDIIAGRVKRAPAAFREHHFEWLYRLMTNPRRLYRQTALPQFVFQVLKRRVIG